MLHPAREALGQFSMDQDRLWLIHTPEFTAGFTEYNDEITGADERLCKAAPKYFNYGDRANYIVRYLAPQMGWKVESIEDRR